MRLAENTGRKKVAKIAIRCYSSSSRFIAARCPSNQQRHGSEVRITENKAAKTRNPLKFAGVSQTTGSISAASGPKSTILRGHVEDILLLYKFFFRSSIRALVAKIWPDKVVQWCPDGDFLCPVFSTSHVQQVSDLHLKFALRPHDVWKYGRHPICGG